MGMTIVKKPPSVGSSSNIYYYRSISFCSISLAQLGYFSNLYIVFLA